MKVGSPPQNGVYSGTFLGESPGVAWAASSREQAPERSAREQRGPVHASALNPREQHRRRREPGPKKTELGAIKTLLESSRVTEGNTDRVDAGDPRALSDAQIDALAQQLIDASYAVIPGMVGLDRVERIRATLARTYASLDAPPMFSKVPIWIGDNIEVSGTGLVMHKVLSFAPDLHRDVLDPDIVEVVRRALGHDMHLEFAGAVVSDYTRPFFKWHNHVGGIDDERYRRLGLRPPIESIQRVAMLVYLDEMGPDTGQLLIHPHRTSGAAPPPGDLHDPDWDGAVRVVGPPGTVVMIDQTTWHAALPRTVDRGPRYFFGLWFAASCAPKSERVDESLNAIESPSALLRSLLPARPQ